MLKKLFVKNYALIESLEIEFDHQLNIITGETGAGKSILMGALGLILGNRADTKQLFDPAKKCIVEGLFSIRDYQLEEFFDENDLEYDEESIIRREINADGKSRAFVNDSPVNLPLLKLLGERLIDIHSQHATLQVSTEQFQFLVVDSVARNTDLLTEYRHNLTSYKQAQQELITLEESVARANSELDYHQFVSSELDTAHLHEGEVEQLEEEQKQLENAEDIKKSLYTAVQILEESPQSVLLLLKDALQEVQKSGKYITPAESLAQRMESCWIELKDASTEISALLESVVVDPERLDFVNNRLSTLYGLIQKYRVADLGELIAYQESIAQKIQDADKQDESLSLARQQVQALQAQTKALADQLSEQRNKVLQQVELAVQNTLIEVGMPHAVLQIVLDPTERFTTHGKDKISFFFAANKGQQPQPIGKVASGGELSRVMLSIKKLITQTSALPTIIFDEIDSGISGEVALRVGKVMEELSVDMQVIAITHLPQIASKGKSHFKVSKHEVSGRTQSQLQLLQKEDRILEIATMLSGADPGDTAIQHAKKVLGVGY